MEWSLILFVVLVNIIAVHLYYFFIYRDNPVVGGLIGFFASAGANTAFFFLHPGHALWPWDCTWEFWKGVFMVLFCTVPLRYLFMKTWHVVLEMKYIAASLHRSTHRDLVRANEHLTESPVIREFGS